MMATSKTGSCSVKGISTAAAMKKIAIRIEPRQELNEKDISFPIKRPSITARKAALKIFVFKKLKFCRKEVSEKRREALFSTKKFVVCSINFMFKPQAVAKDLLKCEQRKIKVLSLILTSFFIINMSYLCK